MATVTLVDILALRKTQFKLLKQARVREISRRKGTESTTTQFKQNSYRSCGMYRVLH